MSIKMQKGPVDKITLYRFLYRMFALRRDGVESSSDPDKKYLKESGCVDVSQWLKDHYEDTSIRNMVLNRAELHHTDFSDITFYRTCMHNADCTNMVLDHAIFDLCDLRGSHFNGASMRDVVVDHGHIEHISLEKADLKGSDFISVYVDDRTKQYISQNDGHITRTHGSQESKIAPDLLNRKLSLNPKYIREFDVPQLLRSHTLMKAPSHGSSDWSSSILMVYRDLYKIPLMKPVMEFIALAMFGLHKKSYPREVDHKKLDIVVAVNTHYTATMLELSSSSQHEDKENHKLHITTWDDFPVDVRKKALLEGALAREFILFAAEMLYGNTSLPFKEGKNQTYPTMVKDILKKVEEEEKRLYSLPLRTRLEEHEAENEVVRLLRAIEGEESAQQQAHYFACLFELIARFATHYYSETAALQIVRKFSGKMHALMQRFSSDCQKYVDEMLLQLLDASGDMLPDEKHSESFLEEKIG